MVVETNTTEENPLATPSTETETPEETEVTTETETDGDETEGEPTEPVAYTPNAKFVVRNEEHAFDDWVLPFIKDEETEKKFKELYEKAKGIDYVKQDRQMYKDTATHLKQQIENDLTPIAQHFQANQHFLQNGDLSSFFHNNNLNPKQILQWAIDYSQLPPAQRVGLDQSAMNNINTVHQNFQTSTRAAQVEQQLVEYRHKEVDWIMSRPDVSEVQRAFDAQRGAGAFKNEVINRGIMLSQQSGNDVPAEQVVQEVVQLIGPSVQYQQQQPIQQQMQQNPQQAVQQQQVMGQQHLQPPQVQPQQAPATVPVIPNIQGRGTSPAKKRVRSLADWDKKMEELG